MTWNFVNSLPIAPRRRLVASAIVYGLSLAIRFTSATGDEMEIPPQAVQSAHPVSSIMINDGAQLFHDWPQLPAQRIGFSRWLLSSRGCRAACGNSMPMSPMPDCSPP
jgi:hypothetical protein